MTLKDKADALLRKIAAEEGPEFSALVHKLTDELDASLKETARLTVELFVVSDAKQNGTGKATAEGVASRLDKFDGVVRHALICETRRRIEAREIMEPTPASVIQAMMAHLFNP